MKRNEENYVVKDACLSVVQTQMTLPTLLVCLTRVKCDLQGYTSEAVIGSEFLYQIFGFLRKMYIYFQWS